MVAEYCGEIGTSSKGKAIISALSNDRNVLQIIIKQMLF